MLRKLAANWLKLDLSKREWIEKAVFFLISLPVLGKIYDSFYLKLVREQTSTGLSRIGIEGYNVCNLKCIMCPYPNMTRKKEVMSMELFSKIIDDAVNAGIQRVELNFYNEPFLDPFLFKRAEYAKEKGMVVEFYSNGTALNEKNSNLLFDSQVDKIIFSIDGLNKETYEKIRVGSKLQEVTSNIQDLIARRRERNLKKPQIGIWFVAQRDNYREIKEFVKKWRRDVDEVIISRADARRTKNVLPLKTSSKPKRSYPCKSFFSDMWVMSDGQVAMCCMDYNGSIILGDLKKQSIDNVWNSGIYSRIRQLHLSREALKVDVCHDTGCEEHYRGAYSWWRRKVT